MAVPPIRLIFAEENPQRYLQAAVSVSSRIFKKAVDRNRIKRMMREAYRLQKPLLEQKLMGANKRLSVFFIYTGKQMPEYNPLEQAMQKLLKKLIELIV